jgi:hypothetical protein
MMQFWINEPTVLLNNQYITELWPSSDMSYEQKMNAVTRLVILISFLGYLLSMKPRILVAGLLTIVCVVILFKMKKPKLTKDMLIEGFEPSSSFNTASLPEIIKSEFKSGDKRNPFSNVLLTQINDEPDRKSAPPAFDPNVEETITKNVKRTVQLLNPGIKNTNKQLYGDLWNDFELGQSNRAFFSTANTRVENDQTAFSNFLYGNMPSSKDSDAAGAMQRVANTNRYTLY